MQDSTLTKQDLFDRTDSRHYLGTDTRGRDHYADPTIAAVWVVADDQLAHIERTRDVSGWVDYVDTHDAISWRTCTYSDQPTGEWLADALAEATA